MAGGSSAVCTGVVLTYGMLLWQGSSAVCTGVVLTYGMLLWQEAVAALKGLLASPDPTTGQPPPSTVPPHATAIPYDMRVLAPMTSYMRAAPVAYDRCCVLTAHRTSCVLTARFVLGGLSQVRGFGAEQPEHDALHRDYRAQQPRPLP
eukprot:1643798-Rhodomonas_salina.1